MGYRRVPVIHTLELKKYDGLVVRMKDIKVGEMRRVLRALEDEELSTDETVGALISALEKNLVSWTLEEEDGSQVPTTREGIESLDLEMLQEIVGDWISSLTGPDEELGKGSSSGENFPGRPVTMEAL